MQQSTLKQVSQTAEPARGGQASPTIRHHAVAWHAHAAAGLDSCAACINLESAGAWHGRTMHAHMGTALVLCYCAPGKLTTACINSPSAEPRQAGGKTSAMTACPVVRKEHSAGTPGRNTKQNYAFQSAAAAAGLFWDRHYAPGCSGGLTAELANSSCRAHASMMCAHAYDHVHLRANPCSALIAIRVPMLGLKVQPKVVPNNTMVDRL